jgi:hypothetical protein
MPQYRNAFRGSVQSTNLVSPGQFQDYRGGGNKKAGLVPLKTAPAMRWIALDVAQTRNTLPNLTNAKGQVIFGLQRTIHPHKALKPVWSTLTPNPYWTIPGTNTKV